MTPVARTLTREELYDRVWTRPMSACAADFGIGAYALTKFCERAAIPYPGRGYWSKVYAGRADPRPPLPPLPPGAEASVTIPKAKPRRARTRLTPAARESQILRVAAEIITREGVRAASMIRIARETGISEAQLYNYFSSQEALLIALARAEYAAANVTPVSESRGGDDYFSRITLSTLTYLRVVEQRGALLQMLLAHPKVRDAISSEVERRRPQSTRQLTENLFQAQQHLSPDTLRAANMILRSVVRRAAQQLARGRAPLATIEQLSLWILLACSKDLFLDAKRTR
ncbi:MULTISPECIES: TetR/AcrR family transcriptional regulator [unclassified Phenylobacterium]|uniref:TetR/AcrR family transcriptional regulator n=1 Tax=unclassified Phenylobacterium TaxID=2640670 RepID=UPI0012E6FC2C|nr:MULTISPECIES: TetR/AcrR family transcriptional regulator [unclassified Phenylobacterium]